jgi:uncharacterized membrane protein YfcA
MHIGFLAAIGVIIAIDIGAWLAKKLPTPSIWVSLIFALVFVVLCFAL